MLSKVKNSVAILLLTLVLLFSYFFQKSSSVSVERATCSFYEGLCEIDTDKGSIRLTSFPETIALEEENHLKLTYPASLTLSNVQITGINMYMGHVPVTFDIDEVGVAHGTFFLGVCSEPNMRWQMALVFTDSQGISSTYYATFATFRD